MQAASSCHIEPAARRQMTTYQSCLQGLGRVWGLIQLLIDFQEAPLCHLGPASMQAPSGNAANTNCEQKAAAPSNAGRRSTARACCQQCWRSSPGGLSPCSNRSISLSQTPLPRSRVDASLKMSAKDVCSSALHASSNRAWSDSSPCRPGQHSSY